MRGHTQPRRPSTVGDEDAAQVRTNLPDGGLYRLVYAQSGSGNDECTVEPLIAVVSSEDEARAVYLDVIGRFPESHVSWEEWPLTVDAPNGMNVESHRLHIVVDGHVGIGMPDNPHETTDPIGVAIHSTRAGAEEHASRLDEDSDRSSHLVLSVPVGYRRPGWPFAGSSRLNGGPLWAE